MASRRALYLDEGGRLAEVPSVDTLTGVVNSDGVASIKKLTQAAYDAIAAKDASVMYVIIAG